MKRPPALRTLLLIAVAGVVAGCAQGSADTSAVDAITRAASFSAGNGARYRIEGTIDAQGQQIPIRGRAAVEPGGQRGLVKMTLLGRQVDSYVDGGHYVIIGADLLPSTAGLPPGTRYLRIDIDRIGASVGINSGPLRKLQSLDPASAARMTASASNLHSVGSASEDGVPVTRYEWSATFGDIADALDNGTGTAKKLPRELRDATISSRIALAAGDRIHSFSVDMAISAMKIEMKTTITSFSKDISVDVPSGSDVFDVTDELSSGLGGLAG